MSGAPVVERHGTTWGRVDENTRGRAGRRVYTLAARGVGVRVGDGVCNCTIRKNRGREKTAVRSLLRCIGGGEERDGWWDKGVVRPGIRPFGHHHGGQRGRNTMHRLSCPGVVDLYKSSHYKFYDVRFYSKPSVNVGIESLMPCHRDRLSCFASSVPVTRLLLQTFASAPKRQVKVLIPALPFNSSTGFQTVSRNTTCTSSSKKNQLTSSQAVSGPSPSASPQTAPPATPPPAAEFHPSPSPPESPCSTTRTSSSAAPSPRATASYHSPAPARAPGCCSPTPTGGAHHQRAPARRPTRAPPPPPSPCAAACAS